MKDIGGVENKTAQNGRWSDNLDEEAKLKSVITEMTAPSCLPLGDTIAATWKENTLYYPSVSYSLATAAPNDAGWADIDIPALILNP